MLSCPSRSLTNVTYFSRRRRQVSPDDPTDTEPLRWRVWSHYRGLLPKAGMCVVFIVVRRICKKSTINHNSAGCHRWGDVLARHTWHRRARGVFGDARPVHANRRGVPVSVRRQQCQVLRGHLNIQRTDQESQRCRRGRCWSVDGGAPPPSCVAHF